ncbi:MAG: RHS repeat-associated core domain-containing protein, partial [Chloroflexota bacterium]
REQRSGATAVDESFVYDGLGNRLTKTDGAGVTTSTYNAVNELVTSTAPGGVVTTSSYDANGNLTLENAAGALTTYSWDGENRLVSVANAGGTETYAYSADGMRQTKATGAGTAYVVRDGENVLMETDGALATVAQHTDLPGMWGGKYSQRRSGVSRFYVPDHQGNTRALLDVGASVTDTLVTDAWGVELARTGATVDPFLAFGQWGYWRDVASRQYVRARHLRADQGRWVSPDPLGFDGGNWNVYGYALNQATIGVDASGLEKSRPDGCKSERCRGPRRCNHDRDGDGHDCRDNHDADSKRSIRKALKAGIRTCFADTTVADMFDRTLACVAYAESGCNPCCRTGNNGGLFQIDADNWDGCRAKDCGEAICSDTDPSCQIAVAIAILLQTCKLNPTVPLFDAFACYYWGLLQGKKFVRCMSQGDISWLKDHKCSELRPRPACRTCGRYQRWHRQPLCDSARASFSPSLRTGAHRPGLADQVGRWA